MKKVYYFLTILAITIISCRKETNDTSQLLVGKWTWKSSLSSSGFQQLLNDSNLIDSFYITFSKDKFINKAGCVIGGQSDGKFETKFVSNKQLLILKSLYSIPDTFAVNINNYQLDLTETNNNYSWKHTFLK